MGENKLPDFCNDPEFRELMARYGIKEQDFTCLKCDIQNECKFAFDLYCVRGDCLSMK